MIDLLIASTQSATEIFTCATLSGQDSCCLWLKKILVYIFILNINTYLNKAIVTNKKHFIWI